MDKNKFLKYLKENNKKQVIFDFDETLCTLLIDWDNWVREMEEIFSSYKIKLNPKEIGYAAVQNYCIEKFGDEARNKIIDINFQNERQFYSGYNLHVDTLQLLQTSRELAQLYIWTSNDRATITPIIEELGLAKFFKRIITRNDVKYIKPSPDGFLLIYDQEHPKSEYLLIGDSRYDSQAAVNAGIDFLHISKIL